MSEIIPFRGFRYDLAQAKDLSLVVTQPYDRISDEDQRVYYGRSPYNLVRLEKGTRKPEDNGENVYTRAGALLREWVRKGILKRDETPSL